MIYLFAFSLKIIVLSDLKAAILAYGGYWQEIL